MSLCRRFFESSVGGKAVVGVTGLLLSGFVLAHLSGNLLVFAGPDAFNAYAAGLRKLGGLLWAARIGLLLVFLIHLKQTIALNIKNSQARPTPYACRNYAAASFASRYMVHTGILIFAFVCYHLAHYTFRVTSPEISALPPEDVYAMVISGFSNPVISGLYIFAMAALALHLYHGVSSAFQSLGLHHHNINVVTDKLGPIIAAIVFLGFSAIPIAVLTGCVH